MGRECEKGRECERTVNAKRPASASPANGEAPGPAPIRHWRCARGRNGALSVVVHVEGVLHRDRALVEYRAEQGTGLRLHAIDERLIRALELGDHRRIVHIVQVRLAFGGELLKRGVGLAQRLVAWAMVFRR